MGLQSVPELAKEEITAALKAAVDAAEKDGELPGLGRGFDIELPRDQGNGDYATSFALKSAKAAGMPPRAIADAIVKRLRFEGGYIADAQAAGPGFINFRLSPLSDARTLELIDELGDNYGRTQACSGKVMVEFVSANPTGVLTVGNARGGVLGDCIAECLSWCGYDVQREYYVNDTGNQVELFARSLEARYINLVRGEGTCPFPEDGYHGEDIVSLAREFADAEGDKWVDKPEDERRAKLSEFGLERNIARIREGLERYRITYDTWFSEKSLHERGDIEETLDELAAGGYMYEQDGALWFKATEFGCAKDEVMRKANGFYTYYASDIAYHRDKFKKREFDRVIDVFGADHHGHTLRFDAGMRAIGIEKGRLSFALYQLVSFVRDGETVRMSKRTGKAITLNDLLDEISVSAARFFFNSQKPDTHLEFDLGLAVKADNENPVYYVQYAFARICSILRMMGEEALQRASREQLLLLREPEETELIRLLARMPEEIKSVAASLDPSRLNRYLYAVAAGFHKFYNTHRVRCDDENLRRARIALCRCTRQVIGNVSRIIKIDSPEVM